MEANTYINNPIRINLWGLETEMSNKHWPRSLSAKGMVLAIGLRLCTVVGVCAGVGVGCSVGISATEAQVPDSSGSKVLPLPGESFQLDGREAFVIMPDTLRRPLPWVWYAPTLSSLPGEEERWMFEQFTRAGIAIAGIDVGESYGSPDGRKLYSALYKELTERRGFSKTPVMLGRSRGGLMTLSWAEDNPDKVASFAGMLPVCNIASYPGVEKASSAYHMTPEELAANLADHNPIDRLEPLAGAGIPLFAIHGDVDTLVPLEENSGEMKRRYEALGCTMELVIAHGQGHTLWEGFFRSQELVDFVIDTAK